MDQEFAEEFRNLGLDIPSQLVSKGGDEIEVWPENAKTVDAFLTLATQWRVAAGFGVLITLGLDYTCVAALFKGKSAIKFKRLLHDLMVMEYAALPILNGGDDA